MPRSLPVASKAAFTLLDLSFLLYNVQTTHAKLRCCRPAGLPLAPGPRSAIAPSEGAFRFWIDFQVLSSPASAALAEKALLLLGGVRTGGPPKLDGPAAAVAKIKDYGYMHMDAWDLLLSITAKAMLAAEILRPGQVGSACP